MFLRSELSQQKHCGKTEASKDLDISVKSQGFCTLIMDESLTLVNIRDDDIWLCNKQPLLYNWTLYREVVSLYNTNPTCIYMCSVPFMLFKCAITK